MKEIYLLYAKFLKGELSAIHAFASEAAAKEYIEEYEEGLNEFYEEYFIKPVEVYDPEAGEI
jgi:hypothetical protein